MFTTKDSGRRSEYASGMVRDTDEGKARFDLLLPKGIPYAKQMLTRFADLMTRGAAKYDERNWELAEGNEELERYYSSALRHLVQWASGETDEDHAAAVMFNIMAAETVKYKMDYINAVEAAATFNNEGMKLPRARVCDLPDCSWCNNNIRPLPDADVEVVSRLSGPCCTKQCAMCSSIALKLNFRHIGECSIGCLGCKTRDATGFPAGLSCYNRDESGKCLGHPVKNGPFFHEQMEIEDADASAVSS